MTMAGQDGAWRVGRRGSGLHVRGGAPRIYGNVLFHRTGVVASFTMTNQLGGRLNPESNKDLEIGDRVVLCESNVAMEGDVVAILEEGYVRVRWSDSGVRTTHRRYALERGRQAA